MTPPMADVHGTGIVVGGRGVLIRGASGAGKTLLALDLLDHAQGRGEAGLLVADDRVEIDGAGAPDRLVMRPPQAIRGLVELRGRGLLAIPFAADAVVDLVVDLEDAQLRMPEPEAFAVTLAGVSLPRCPVPRRGVADPVHQRLLVRAALAALD